MAKTCLIYNASGQEWDGNDTCLLVRARAGQLGLDEDRTVGFLEDVK